MPGSPVTTGEPPAPPEPPTDVHEPSPGAKGPKRAALSAPVVIALVVAGIAWGVPILQGFHFGCNLLAGDQVRSVRLGVEMCRGENQAERSESENAARSKQEAEQQAQNTKERNEAEEKQGEERAEAQQREEERPAHEAAAAKLSGEASTLHKRQQHVEGLVTADEREAEHLEAIASHVSEEEPSEGGGHKNEEADRIRESADASREHADAHRANVDNLRSESETKAKEATEEREKE